jgi:hypothetical protein
MRQLAVALLLSSLGSVAAHAAENASAEAYSRCTSAVTKPGAKPSEGVEACLQSAQEGVPGAQYAMGALMINASGGKASPEAIAWLEKAVAQGHAGAAYVLGSVLQTDVSQTKRARDLLRMSACGEYGAALAAMKKAGGTIEQLHCVPREDTDFTGEWSGTLKWTTVSPGASSGPELKVVLAAGDAHVFMKVQGEWLEVKPGKVHVTQLQQTAVLSAIDSGSDFDGVWIEAWDIHLLRLSADEAVLSYMRTVNNRDMPASLSWRTFTTAAEGHVRRTAKPSP